MPDLPIRRLALRLVVGATSLGLERMRSLEQPVDGRRGRSRVLHACLGGALLVDQRITRGLASFERELPVLLGRLSPLARRVWWTRSGHYARERGRQFRQRFDGAVDRLATIGAHEQQAARELAGSAVQLVIGSVINQTAQSPEIERVVSDATADVSQSTLREIRTRGAQADALAESLLRRLLRRRNRPAQPAPEREP